MYTKLLVETILKYPVVSQWSVQGLGMMRMYLSPEIRLHVWDSSLKVPGASAIHNHPWDLDSLVVAGRYKQHRYSSPKYGLVTEEFNCSLIKCGEEACVMEEPTKVMLAELALEVYRQDATYHQDKDEIHFSCPEDGTVTLVKRKFHEDRDHAKVFWRGSGKWVDAKPRQATVEEVIAVTQRALTTWF